ncbi:MAG: tRNA adenosine(34) deaminase TadA [Candidatus Omnitrophica bacterium]|nr:tRNA adenosine(34) deaminase TadA [Candidatus Omnitrophota bacterium]MBU0896491.1 tRNA adenosine(34) deaminase TadA [Candidatus Omnitrophota bacterium]MBU1366668.1 tRNA adenosine(34) deaminase TadA [Candidatus Omnitrophota bacterium]MBU1523609.1 tRNA adenosine(34) deaminase TadA [Candidatus Omnitrophota bacterium]MBU1810640.1 tRNA adenosine(34) deaminase TadA [Candidatus Omnitrophota bacterium]
MKKDEIYMRKALNEALYAFDEDEVPVGAVIVYKDKIIAKAHNQVERLCDPTAHAEIVAITSAASFLKSKWLKDCALYVTVEPCTMCAGALILSRIDKIIFGASDPKTGAFGSKVDVNALRLNHKIKVKSGVLERECGQILKDFFKKKRKYNKKIKNDSG